MRSLQIRERVITGLFFLISVLLTCIFLVSHIKLNDSFERAEWVNHTNVVIAQIRNVLTVIENAESSQRNYILLGKPDVLKNHESVVARIQPEIAALTKLIRNKSSQFGSLDKLNALVKERLGLLNQGLEIRDKQSFAAALRFIADSRGAELMNEIRSHILEMVDVERELLRQREEAALASLLHTKRIILFSSVLAIISLLLCILLLRIELRQRKQAMLEKEESKQTALKALAARSVFLANMSHEIRTPLHSIIGMADVWGTLPGEAEKEKCVAIIRRASNLLMNLINDILDLSKIEAGKLEIDSTDFNLAELVEQTTAMIEFRAGYKGLALSYKIQNDVPLNLIGDPNRIRQILLNLLGNAIKFTEKGSVVLTVTARGIGEERRICFSVQDTGMGIAADKQQNIFEEFNQIDPSISRSYGGTGLGLTISQQLVELMKGTIWFDSEEGKGSTFYVELPLQIRMREKVGISPTLQLRDSRTLRILIVDDIEDNRLLMQLYLKHLPYRLEFAQNGGEALEKHFSQPFDLIIMDMHMPKLNGYETVKRIREEERLKNSPKTYIIALTAYALKEDAEKSLAAGCDKHVTKPVTREVLQKNIAEAPIVLTETSSVVPLGPIVYLKRDLGPLIPGFLENRKKDLAQIQAAVRSRDFEAVESLGHIFKGTSGQFGFSVLCELGEKMGQAAKRSDLIGIDEMCARASVYLKQVDISYL